MVYWTDNAHESWPDPQCTKFVLEPSPESTNKFHIEMPYGETRPMLSSYGGNVTISSNLVASAKTSITEDQSLWTISQV